VKIHDIKESIQVNELNPRPTAINYNLAGTKNGIKSPTSSTNSIQPNSMKQIELLLSKLKPVEKQSLLQDLEKQLGSETPASQSTATGAASYAAPGSVKPSSVTYKDTPAAANAPVDNQPNIDKVLAAVNSLNKQGKKQVHKQLEKELYGDRSDTGRRELSRQMKPANATNEPISIGGQKINPTDPLYAKIKQQAGK
jgi:hypothetical protein